VADELRVGIIGFDTSHGPAFSQLLMDADHPFHMPGLQVVAGYPSYSPDLEFSATRVQQFTQEMIDVCNPEIMASAEELAEAVDAVLLLSVDGRRHLGEIEPALRLNKSVFIDKPMAASYADAAAIAQLVREHNGRAWSASSLRFDANIQSVLNDEELGEIVACDAYSPANLDTTNPGFFWYGVHGVETLYTYMGMGCESVYCKSSEGSDVAIGRWADGRLGTMRGTRQGTHDYGVRVFGANKTVQMGISETIPLYVGLVRRIVDFFQGGEAPISLEETLETVAFMEAALISSQENRWVDLAEMS